MKAPFSGTAVDEQHTLTETGVLNESTLMEVSSAQPSTSPRHPVMTIENDFIPDVLTAQVQTGKKGNWGGGEDVEQEDHLCLL